MKKKKCTDNPQTENISRSMQQPGSLSLPAAAQQDTLLDNTAERKGRGGLADNRRHCFLIQSTDTLAL